MDDVRITEVDALGAGLPPDEIEGYTFEEQPEDEDLARPAPPKFYSVAICMYNKQYGGPEEGGWWYSTYEPIDQLAWMTKIVLTSEEARSAKTELERVIVDKEFNKGRRPVSSVLSTGQYVAVIFPGTYPEYLPTSRPHYE